MARRLSSQPIDEEEEENEERRRQQLHAIEEEESQSDSARSAEKVSSDNKQPYNKHNLNAILWDQEKNNSATPIRKYKTELKEFQRMICERDECRHFATAHTNYLYNAAMERNYANDDRSASNDTRNSSSISSAATPNVRIENVQRPEWYQRRQQQQQRQQYTSSDRNSQSDASSSRITAASSLPPPQPHQQQPVPSFRQSTHNVQRHDRQPMVVPDLRVNGMHIAQ